MESFANAVDKSEIISSAIDDIGEDFGKFSSFTNDSWHNNGDKCADKANYENIRKSNWQGAGFAWKEACDAVY